VQQGSSGRRGPGGRGRVARWSGPVIALGLVATVLVGRQAAAGAAARVDPGLGYDPADLGSASSVTQIVGAQAAWARGWTGAGVDVAVIDTGVAPVPGLDAPGKVVTGPDLSFDAPASSGRGGVTGLDAYGHGTFMAGLIAGRDASAHSFAQGCGRCLNGSGYSDTTTYVGVAPDARIVNVKVGAADGAADVTQVIAAIDWVVQHAHDPGLNIRVISLSYGTDSTQTYQKDPLAQAAEQAWKHGIVVVAASGNDGKATNKVASPGYDPYLLAVGADNPKRTLATVDDVVPAFAQHGNSKRPIDLVAPAMHLIGLRVPGSFVDTLPTNSGQVGTRFQRGTGTSQATAIAAGVVALVLQKHPSATPDQVKALLTATAVAPDNPEAKTEKVHWGHGVINAAAAVTASLPPVARAAQAFEASNGKGSLDESRGGVHVADGGIDLRGDRDVFGAAFVAKKMAAAQTSAAAWNGGIWNGNRWTGDGWNGNRWTAAAWSGRTWAGNRWTGNRWTDMSWDGNRWTGSGWRGNRWTGTGWDASRWSTSTSD
jgi:serine protease AprX